jgi:hypothetical protein
MLTPLVPLVGTRLLTCGASCDPRLEVTQPKHTMPPAMAAQILGVTPGALHNYDDELEPVRDRHGRRWFDPAIVERVAAQRAARKGGAR